VKLLVGRVGLEPRPADYEKYGPALRMRYLHGYHGVVPPMALVAPFARVTRSTNRSTSLLVGTSIGDWIGGLFGNFVAALLSIPVAGALQVIARELWQATAWAGSPDSEPPAEPGPAVPGEEAPETGRELRDGEPEPTRAELRAPTFDLSGEPCAWPRSDIRIFHSL
jgi:hypothetical protein